MYSKKRVKMANLQVRKKFRDVSLFILRVIIYNKI